MHLQAPDAAALMRSRYSAYVLSLTDYLLATWHPTTRPAAMETADAGLRWLGLDVRGHTKIDADHATVEFVARSKAGGRAHRLHEISRFIRVISSDTPPPGAFKCPSSDVPAPNGMMGAPCSAHMRTIS